MNMLREDVRVIIEYYGHDCSYHYATEHGSGYTQDIDAAISGATPKGTQFGRLTVYQDAAHEFRLGYIEIRGDGTYEVLGDMIYAFHAAAVRQSRAAGEVAVVTPNSYTRTDPANAAHLIEEYAAKGVSAKIVEI